MDGLWGFRGCLGKTAQGWPSQMHPHGMQADPPKGRFLSAGPETGRSRSPRVMWRVENGNQMLVSGRESWWKPGAWQAWEQQGLGLRWPAQMFRWKEPDTSSFKKALFFFPLDCIYHRSFGKYGNIERKKSFIALFLFRFWIFNSLYCDGIHTTWNLPP